MIKLLKKNYSENNKKNTDLTYELNESLNDKLNNLEKVYQNFNPDNKTKNQIKEGNTKEVINTIIHECMDILEKEEDNNIKISIPDNSKNCIKIDKDNKPAPLIVNNFL